MLLKPTGAVPHVGGVLTAAGRTVLRAALATWIAQGVKLDVDGPRVSSIEVLPKNPVIPLPGMKQQMAVFATYSRRQQPRRHRRGVSRKQQHRGRHRR